MQSIATASRMPVVLGRNGRSWAATSAISHMRAPTVRAFSPDVLSAAVGAQRRGLCRAGLFSSSTRATQFDAIWPDHRKQKSADSLYNLYKWYGLHTPLKMFKKISQKFNDKTVQSNILWLNVIKIDGISILQSAHKQGNPSFHFHAPGSKRRYPCTQTASAVPNCLPCLLQFSTGYRIWHASRAWKQKTSEKRSFSHN